VANYVDGFVIPIPKRNIDAYRRMARKAGKIWREHGALEYRECIADEVKPYSGSTRYEPVPVTGPRGTVMIFHGGLWHRNGRNRTTGEKRRGILTYYCRPFLRQQENFFRSLDPAVLERATPRLRQLLGYEMWLGGVGMIGGLPRNAQRY
jgi:ectoine hydroxylase-related dioxygenase (phytanoyl-CoA dioxygenase family)